MMTDLMGFDEVIKNYDPALGLEIHVELDTESKMLCGYSTEFGAEPNTQTCPVCLGLPGTLPVVNAKVVESAIRIGLALGCQIAPRDRFARKNYLYSNMIKNFQAFQCDEPIVFDGRVKLEVDGEGFAVEAGRAHMEEDTGELIHIGVTGRIHGAGHSVIDYNRADIPLIKIVTRFILGIGAKAP